MLEYYNSTKNTNRTQQWCQSVSPQSDSLNSKWEIKKGFQIRIWYDNVVAQNLIYPRLAILLPSRNPLAYIVPVDPPNHDKHMKTAQGTRTRRYFIP